MQKPPGNREVFKRFAKGGPEEQNTSGDAEVIANFKLKAGKRNLNLMNTYWVRTIELKKMH